MQTSTDLRNLLARIDRKGYPAYKDTRGAYQFPAYVLSIDHVQGDPFASPSKVSITVPHARAGYPGAYLTRPGRKRRWRIIWYGSSGGRSPSSTSRPRGRARAA